MATVQVSSVMLNLVLLPFLALLGDSRELTHREFRIDERDIINLPAGRFPEPNCQYTVLERDIYGPKLAR